MSDVLHIMMIYFGGGYFSLERQSVNIVQFLTNLCLYIRYSVKCFAPSSIADIEMSEMQDFSLSYTVSEHVNGFASHCCNLVATGPKQWRS